MESHYDFRFFQNFQEEPRIFDILKETDWIKLLSTTSILLYIYDDYYLVHFMKVFFIFI